MPAKKIDPEEHKRNEKRITVKKKLAFAVSIGILVLVTNLFMMLRPPTQDEADAQQERVLGDSATVSDEDKARIERVQKQATDLAETITTQSEAFVEDSREKAEETLSDVVYRTTIRPLINKIESLPDDQQEYVKEQLCRPETTPEAP